MKLNSGYSCGAVLALLMAAGPAWAELTAQEVWSDWRDYMSGMGYAVSGTEDMSGNTLTVSDLSMSMALDETGTVSLTADSIAFTENGDGTVSIALPATMPVIVEGTDSGETYNVQVNVEQTGHTMTASGSPEALTYAYTAAEVMIRLASVTVDGEDQSSDVKVEVKISTLTSTTDMTRGDLRSYSQQLDSDGVEYVFTFDDPASVDNGTVTGSLAGLAFAGKGMIPEGMNAEDMHKMLEAGFEFDGTFTYGAGKTNINGQDGEGTFQFSSASKGGTVTVGMDKTQLTYGVAQDQTAVNVAGSEIPFPIALEMAKTGFRLLMPVAQSEEEQNFELSFTLGDFTMSEMIWSIFDAGGVLPRDPATIAIDLAGKVKVLADLLDPEMAEEIGMSDTPPGELHALTINNLLVSAAGAKLSGSGDFTFDNADLETFDGLPRPTGGVDMEIVGANGLIDRLIQMGLMSDQDAMGARMMLGMIGVPAKGEDTLKSKIEINDQGHVIANGQRLQ